MKRTMSILLLLLLTLSLLSLAGCREAQFKSSDKRFEGLDPEEQEEAYEYRLFFRPQDFGGANAYVGDPMPYYEDGTYYIFYLKEGGDSYNHSIFLTTTRDFLRYQEHEGPILESGSGQDAWIGTGSVVKVGGAYYLFYTAHAGAGEYEFKETIRVAKGSSLTDFSRVSDWELTPPEELGQKNDFRDPQAYYDADSDSIVLTVTAAQDGVARILKYTLSADLGEARYDGVIFTDPTKQFWNLECSDTFQLGGRWYITYSGQDDTLWYAFSDNRYGPYGEARRIDGKLFYAAKHVEDGENSYMVGWARRSESPYSTGPVTGWAGNLLIQKLRAEEDGTLVLEAPKALADSFTQERPLLLKDQSCTLEAQADPVYTEAFTAYERYMLTGSFTCTGEGEFGLAFDFDGSEAQYKRISLDPADDRIQLSFADGYTEAADTAAVLDPGKSYSFTYFQEGSVGVFYLDGEAALTVRLYGSSGKSVRLFAADNSVTFTDLCEYTMP